MNHQFLRVLRVLVVLIIFCLPLQAHDYWLEPTKTKVQPGEEVQVRLMFGKDFGQGVEKPLLPDRTPLFKRFGGSGRPLNLLKDASSSPTPAATIQTKKAGNLLIAMERSASVTRFGRARFLEQATSEGVTLTEFEMPAGARAAFDNHSRYLKALIQVGDKPSKIDTRPLGLTYELVPITSPFAPITKPGPEVENITFQLLFDGHPSPNRLVSACWRKNGLLSRHTATTDAEGLCTFPIAHAGRWAIRSVKIDSEPSTKTGSANFRSYWASLTFGYE